MTILPRLVCTLVLIFCINTVGVALPSALAQPAADGSDEPGAGPAIDWPRLGLPNEVLISSSTPEKTVTVPVPDGYLPAALTGQVEAVSNAVNCRLEVYDADNRFLGPIAPAEGQTVSSFVLDISNASVGQSGVELSFYLRQAGPPAELCTQISQPSSMTLSQLATSFSGAPTAPGTVAGFLPGYLSRIVVGIGPNPSESVQQTALSLVAYLTRLYRPMPVRIDVDTSTDPVAPREDYGASRMIAIREGPTAGLSVVDSGTPQATLVISGQGDGLRQQVELFADRRFEIAQTASANVTAAAQFPMQTGTVKTFGELRMSGQLSVIGTDTMYLGFDASEFGVGPIEGAEINLLAKYTPVIDGEGSVLVRAGPDVIATHVLDHSGSLETKVRIPADVIQSNVGLGLEIRYLPSQNLAPPARITFAVLPQSTVQVTPGTQTSRGFSVLPMAFVPQFKVAVDQPDHIRFAAAAINLMGQQTAVALRPLLVPLDDAGDSSGGLLVIAAGEELSRRGLDLPIAGMANDEADIRGDPATDINLDGPLGVIQTATTDRGTVLAVSAVGDWKLIDRTFDYIRALPGQWRTLTGDVVVTGALGDSVNLIIDQGGGWPDLNPGSGWTRWAWLSIVITVGLIALGAVMAAVRIRRTKSDDAVDDSPQPP